MLTIEPHAARSIAWSCVLSSIDMPPIFSRPSGRIEKPDQRRAFLAQRRVAFLRNQRIPGLLDHRQQMPQIRIEVDILRVGENLDAAARSLLADSVRFAANAAAGSAQTGGTRGIADVVPGALVGSEVRLRCVRNRIHRWCGRPRLRLRCRDERRRRSWRRRRRRRSGWSRCGRGGWRRRRSSRTRRLRRVSQRMRLIRRAYLVHRAVIELRQRLRRGPWRRQLRKGPWEYRALTPCCGSSFDIDQRRLVKRAPAVPIPLAMPARDRE